MRSLLGMTLTEADLSPPERACFELAWEALREGNLPVGAVVVDGAGRTVAAGRNRIHENHAPAPQLANNLLAHAEVNALVQLSPALRYPDHQLISTLEPCILCVGATSMATVGRLTFVGSDPYGGAAGGILPTPHTDHVPVEFSGPRADSFGLLAAGLHMAFFLRRKPSSHVMSVHRQLRPDLAEAGEALVGAGLFDLAAGGVTWSAAVGRLLSVV